MNILLCTNGRYAKFAAISIYSILKNNCNENINFYIFIDNTVTDVNDFNKIQNCYSNSKIQLINVDKISKTLFSNLYLKTPEHISAYFRLLIFVYLQNLDRLLYIDSDIICLKPIHNLYYTDLGENLIGAVPEYVLTKGDHPTIKRRYKKMADYFIEKFKSDLNGYFNSGVMLFNLNKIKDKNREFIRLMKIARKNNNFFHDQNVFNIVYKNKVHFLDWNANVLNDLRSLACLRFEFDIIKNYQKLTTDPIFLHFTPTRPWDNSNVENANLWNSMKQELDKL